MKRIKVYIILSMFLFLPSSSGFAEIIQLKSGKVVRGQVVEDDGRKLKIDTGERELAIPYRMIEFRGSEADYEKAMAAVPTDAVPQIDVYLANWCPSCNEMEHYLKSNSIPYNRYNIDFSSNKAEYKALGGKAIPFVVVDGKYTFTGFHPDTLQRYIKKAARQKSLLGSKSITRKR